MISWVPPYNGGSALTGYNIQILESDGLNFIEQLDYCNGRTDTTIL